MDAIEREQVEIVFGLTGGELSDTPDPGFPFTYWYDGAPEYLERRLVETVEWCACHNTDNSEDCSECNGRGYYELRTTVVCCLYGYPTVPEGWEQVPMVFGSSGEAGCLHCGPGSDWDGSAPQTQAKASNSITNTGYRGNPECKLCEGSGYVYLGDGWCEIVYRRAYPKD